MANRRLAIEPQQGYDPEIGHWMWAMQEVRRRTLRLVKDLNQKTLDWEGSDGRENAIGSLLYHIPLVEMSWLFMDILCQEIPPHVLADFPQEMSDAEGRLTSVLGVPLADHLARLERSREIFLDAFRGISIDDGAAFGSHPMTWTTKSRPNGPCFTLSSTRRGTPFRSVR